MFVPKRGRFCITIKKSWIWAGKYDCVGRKVSDFAFEYKRKNNFEFGQESVIAWAKKWVILYEYRYK